MSLINRMLDELAARQAPGTEALQGVRLNEPLERARRGVDRTTLVVLALLVAAVPGLCWWLWPRQVEPPVPRARPTPVEAVSEAPPAPVPASADAPADPVVADVPAPHLQLAARLESLDETGETPRDVPPPATPVARVGPTPKPEAKPTPPPKPAPVEPAPIEFAPDASIDAPTPILAPAAVPAVVDPSVERKQRARLALADQDPAGALQSLGPADAAQDVESVALRAQALQRLGRHAQAADAYAQLTARDPAEPAHWVGLAISLESEQRREPARLAYRRALQSDRLAPSLRAFALGRLNVLESP